MKYYSKIKFAILPLIAATATNVAADEGSFGIGYSTADIDYTVAGVTVGLELDGITWGGTVPISDNLYASLSRSDMDGDLLGFKFELDATNFGAGLYFADDFDLEAGDGVRYSIGLTSSSQKISARVNNVSYSESENFTFVDFGFDAGIAPGSRVSFGVSGDIDDFNPMYRVSAAIKAGPGNFLIGYNFSTDTINTVKIESRQLSAGYSLSF